MSFITAEQVDSLLGSDWAQAATKPLAVYQANTYLSTLNFKTWEEQPEAVTRAGAELAREAANERLFVESEGVIKRERVKGDTVEVDTEYAAGSTTVSSAMAFIDALLSPWLVKRQSWALLKRL